MVRKLEDRKVTLEKLLDMDARDVGSIVRVPAYGSQILKYVNHIPYLEVTATVQPITRTVLKVDLVLDPQFEWIDRFHGGVEPFWVWVEDAENEHIYHKEYFLLQKVKARETHKLNFTIPIFEPLPPQYYVKVVSDRWLGSECVFAISFKQLILPELHPPHTKLLDLHPVPVTALYNKEAQNMYPYFTHFNPVQTQAFHTCYHTDENILLGAPTGSGKTIVAELCMMRLFALSPGKKCVYIAPMKALARERVEGWRKKSSFAGCMNKTIVELTGDTAPDGALLKKADILITTPEKWDGVSRSWKSRGYVKNVGLVVIDEIHLLGQDRGPILEVIVSRMRYISSHTEHNVRIVGLSTALANARDVADWLGIEGPGLFNFHPVVRPVPITCHIQGFSGKAYCPRMATMNKPTYAAIMTHSPSKPVLVFVSSRRQTRLTALELISFSAGDGKPHKFLRMNEEELEYYVASVKDPNLKHMLTFGIGMHHAGLPPKDRSVVEELFVSQKIQVLVCTSTLAWGVNFPAHLVVIKGTEYYDAKVSRYVDFPITDVLQMMGRAGRPQFDQDAKAVVLVHEPKKNFYKSFLHHPFPVESSLLECLHDHINAEVVGGTITSVQDAIDYLTWTFFFRRLLVNPSFYNLDDSSPDGINTYLINLVHSTFTDLENAGCLLFEDGDNVESLSLGKICSYYYLKYTTVQMFSNKLTDRIDLPGLLDVLTSASEYEELPVRHNEDKLNEEMSSNKDAIRWPVDVYSFDSPFTKANLLLQAWFSRSDLPISDYVTDTKSVLDQAIRILQAMVDVCAEAGWLDTTLHVMNLTQMVTQGRWFTDSTLSILPNMSETVLAFLWQQGIQCLPELVAKHSLDQIYQLLVTGGMNKKHAQDAVNVATKLPDVKVSLSFDEGYQTVYQSEETKVNITLVQCNKSSGKAYCPKFPKPRAEGWWLVLGRMDQEGDAGNELMALKRTFVSRSTKTELYFEVPEEPGEYTYTLFLMSDSYLGMDQQYDFVINVMEGQREEDFEGDEGENEDSDLYDEDELYGEEGSMEGQQR